MSGNAAVHGPIASLRLVAGLFVVCGLSFVAFFALLAYAPDFREETDGGAHALSKSAIGFAALRIFLHDAGVPVAINRGVSGYNTPQLTVFTPGPENTGAEMNARDYLEPRLIILPKWLPVGDPLQRDRVVKVGMLGAPSISLLLKSFSAKSSVSRLRGEMAPTLKIAWPDADILLPGHLAPINSLQTLHGPDWEPILVSTHGGAVLARLQFSQVYVLADPDLMNAHGLHDLSTAAMALSIVRFAGIGEGPVVFDVTLNGFRNGPSLLRDVFAPPFLGATLCAILAAALLSVHAFNRFGSPERKARAFALGKAALVDNTAQLIRMTHREPRMAERYALAARHIALQAVGARRDANEADGLILALERRGEANFAELLARARECKSRSDLLNCAGELFRWRERIVRGA